MYKLHTSCRACGLGANALPTLKHSTAAGPGSGSAETLQSVFNLGVLPLANDFCGPSDNRAGYAPLNVMLCPRCGLAQLSVVVRPEILYRNYPYVTSNSATMRNHFANLRYDIGDESDGFKNVLEIGSNDGTFMRFLGDHGARCLGIDPAANLCDIANKRGTPTLCGMFAASSEAWVRKELGKVDVVIARHVFAHVDDWRGFVEALESVTTADTLICLEVPYVADQLEGLSFDQIYHEHLSYVSVGSIEALLHGTGLRLHRVIHYRIHGGCILIMLRSRSSKEAPHSSVAHYLSDKKVGAEQWKNFAVQSRNLIKQLSSFVKARAAEGRVVVGYGASAKSAQWLNLCEFTRRDIRFICDNTPQKQYRNCPGSEIPVVDDGALTRELPEYAVCFAWNFFKEILEKEEIFRKKGGKWIVPVPKLEVI